MSPGTTPEWVKPTAQEINDLHWLAVRMYADTGRHFFGGVAATLGWIHGDREAPITENPTQPVTRELASAEAREALRAGAGLGPHGGRFDRRWSDGVEGALAWLMRIREGVTPPLALPVRNPDGTVPTVEELVETEIAANPHRDWRRLPELRVEARRRAADVHARSRYLVALIDETLSRTVA